MLRGTWSGSKPCRVVRGTPGLLARMGADTWGRLTNVRCANVVRKLLFTVATAMLVAGCTHDRQDNGAKGSSPGSMGGAGSAQDKAKSISETNSPFRGTSQGVTAPGSNSGSP